MKMSIPMLHRLANSYDVEIPDKAPDKYTITNSFLDELALESKKEIISRYGDAGRVSSFIYKSREKTPTIQNVYKKAKALSDQKPESEFWENYPYIEDVEVDYATNTLRIHFHYLHGAVILIDEKTGRPKEQRRFWNGTVIYRPESSILEIRVKHRSMARRMRARIPTYLGLEPFFH
jgi:hypothetical protein